MVSANGNSIVENFKSIECDLSAEELIKVDLLAEKYLTRFLDPSESWGVKLFEGLEGV